MANHFSLSRRGTEHDNYGYIVAHNIGVGHPPTHHNNTVETIPPQYSDEEFWSNGTKTLLMSPPTTDSSLTPTSPDALIRRFTNRHRLAPFATTHAGNKTVMTKSTTSQDDNSVRNSILAGSISGMTSVSIFHPLDVLRTKIQFSNSPSLKEITVGIRPPQSPITTFVDTIRHGGYRALYTGLSFPLMAQALYKATVFTINGATRRALIEHKTQERHKIGMFTPYKLTLGDAFFCGAVGGAVNGAVFVSPVEYVRNTLIAQHSRLSMEEDGLRAASRGGGGGRGVGVTMTAKKDIMNGPIDVVKRTLRSTGVFGLWRGVGVTTVRDSCGVGMFFLTFETSKKYLSRWNGGVDNYGITLLSGASAGLGFWLVAMPLDTVKTLVQTGSSPNAFRVFADYWARDGVFGILKMYKGWQVAFGRGAPSAAVTMGTFDYFYRILPGSDSY